MNTILDLFNFIQIKYPNHSALAVRRNNKWKYINYTTYYNECLKFANTITHLCNKKDITTCIIGYNAPGWFYSHLGTMMTGGKSIGIYPTCNSDMCEYIINNTKPDILVVQNSYYLNKFTKFINNSSIKYVISYSAIISCNLNIPVYSWKDIKLYNNILNYPNVDDIATIIYTSGTTGKPSHRGVREKIYNFLSLSKEVIITHKNIISMISSLLKSCNNLFEYGKKERIISYLPLNHIAAQLTDIYLSLATLTTVYFTDPKALKSTLVYNLEQVKPTIFMGVPRVFEKIKEKLSKYKLSKYFKSYTKYKLGLDQCKYIISTGAPIDLDTLNFFKSLDLTIYNAYGLSETCGPVTISTPHSNKTGSVGKPIKNIQIKIINNEILIKGPTVTTNDWFNTGDLGYFDNDGYLFITGRSKDIIITSGGENISPKLIEDRIKKYIPEINHVIIIGNKKKYLTCLLFTKKNINDKILNNKFNLINKQAISPVHTIKKWKLLHNKLSIENGELTPTMKLKKDYIIKKYNKYIKDMY